MVVCVTRITASPSTARGRSPSSTRISLTPRKTFALIFSISHLFHQALSMLVLPVLFMRTLGPSPEATLFDAGRLVFRHLIMHKDRVRAAFVNYQTHLMFVLGLRHKSFELGSDI